MNVVIDLSEKPAVEEPVTVSEDLSASESLATTPPSTTPPPPSPEASSGGRTIIPATPAVRKIAKENQVRSLFLLASLQ